MKRGRDPSLAVAAAGLRLALGEGLFRRRRGDVLERRMRLEPDARRSRLYLLVAIVFSLYRLTMGLHALDELGRLLSLLEPDVGFAPVAALADEAAHALHLSANVEDADFFDLDLEELFDGLLDLDLVRAAARPRTRSRSRPTRGAASIFSVTSGRRMI
jgi:hypothetical protein